MRHKFTPSQLDSIKCRLCERSKQDHTNSATCESCGNSGSCEIFPSTDILMCQDCYGKELQSKGHDTDIAEKVFNDGAAGIMEISRAIDSSVKVKEDIFNAKTIAIIELKKVIDADDSIAQKHLTLARVLEERYSHLLRIVDDAQTEQRAIQTYYQDLKKELSERERAEIKLRDVSYQPKEPKKVTVRKITTKKFDLDEVKRIAKDSGLPITAIQTMCVARGCSPLDAVRLIKEMMQ